MDADLRRALFLCQPRRTMRSPPNPEPAYAVRGRHIDEGRLGAAVDGVPNVPTRDGTATALEGMVMRAVDVEHHGLIAVLELPRSRSRISYAEARA